MVVLFPQVQSHTSVEAAVEALETVRRRTNELVAPLGEPDLERSHSPLMSPLVWDLGHIAAYEDLWISHRFGGRPLVRPDLAGVYDAFETPRANRHEVELLPLAACREYVATVRAHTLEVIDRQGVGDGRLIEMVIQHECQHTETMLQALQLARLPGYAPPSPQPLAPAVAAATGLEFVEVPAGPFALGAPDGRFSYDNERPRHVADVAAFRIGIVPVTNGAWRAFVEGGGYGQREWWSQEGWAWLREHGLCGPDTWRLDEEVLEWRLNRWEPLDARKPVIHISWFEADAFARAHGARLPTEAEWEKAAVWDPASGETCGWPWDEPPSALGRANLAEAGLGGTAPVGSFPSGMAPSGALGMVGDVWEWTASSFRGYPGFVADPYPEYSEVFFGAAYKVLRGGSWATSARVATPTFRNWDYPQRRQIFAGLRLAGDVS